MTPVLLVGGVFAGTTGSADLPGEFNVWCDPEAAAVVLQSGVMATLVGLDITRRIRLTRAEADAMAADPHPFAACAGRYSRAWIDHLAETDDPATDSCALHDPLAVAAVTRPDLLTFAEVNLAVQRDGVARGVMVADRRTSAARPANARIAVDVNPPGFAAHFTGNLRRL
jgi:inosine-uridine nucleoside N-ribohydrolase